MKTLDGTFSNKQIVIFASVLMISLNVAFAGTKLPSNRVNHDKCNFSGVKETNVSEYYSMKELARSIFETAKEENIALESWMTDLSSFRNSEKEIFEEDIPLEDWMTNLNDQNWINTHETEEKIDLEAWMLDLNYWKPATR